jgi:hypothetical protein
MTVAPARLLALLVLPLAALSLGHGLQTVERDLAHTLARNEVGFWGRGDYRPAAGRIDSTGQAIDALLRNEPAQPDYLALRARYSTWRAYWSTDLRRRQAFNDEAMAYQLRSLRARPAHRHGWAKMVEYASGATAGEPVLRLARERMVMLAPGKS